MKSVPTDDYKRLPRVSASPGPKTPGKTPSPSRQIKATPIASGKSRYNLRKPKPKPVKPKEEPPKATPKKKAPKARTAAKTTKARGGTKVAKPAGAKPKRKSTGAATKPKPENKKIGTKSHSATPAKPANWKSLNEPVMPEMSRSASELLAAPSVLGDETKNAIPTSQWDKFMSAPGKSGRPGSGSRNLPKTANQPLDATGTDANAAEIIARAFISNGQTSPMQAPIPLSHTETSTHTTYSGIGPSGDRMSVSFDKQYPPPKLHLMTPAECQALTEKMRADYKKSFSKDAKVTHFNLSGHEVTMVGGSFNVGGSIKIHF